MLVSDNPTYELFGVDLSVDEYDILIVNKIFFFRRLSFFAVAKSLVEELGSL